MSQATLETKTPQTPPPRDERTVEQRYRGSRAVIILVLIVALAVSALAREGARRVRISATPMGQTAAGGTGQGIAGMNSFALALLLGGLRGPLVMMLWTSSETQKTERQLEDFDTKVEWIRLLQPEFDTVHLFQVWNKAYNISVQMASLSNKYSTILDAIDYAREVDTERPNNINIIHQIGSVYFDKLGNSHEKAYFTRRLREESLTRPGHRTLARTDPGWRRIEHDPMLDQDGYILPELLRPNPRFQVGSPDSGQEFNDGSELQYLARYEPFPYGLSPFAVGYNNFKRAQVLQSVGRQRHIQLSDLVVDSRPAVALKFWNEEERERGRRMELRAFGLPVPTEKLELELPAAGLSVDQQPANVELLHTAIHGYDMSARLARDARPEYERHLRNFTRNYSTYQAHLDNLEVVEALAAGDRDYLRAMLASGPERDAKLADAARHYQQAIDAAAYVILRYYTEESVVQAVFPPGVTRYELRPLTSEQRWEILRQALRATAGQERWYDPYGEDRQEYELYIQRAMQRMEQLSGRGDGA